MAVNPIPPGCEHISPSLTIRGAAEAIQWYEKVFGARQVTCMMMPDGHSVAHAELAIGPSKIYVADEFPSFGSFSPKHFKGTSVAMSMYVKDVDAVYQRAIANGATVTMQPMDQFWGDRFGKLVDPFGHAWALMTHIEDVSQEEMARRGQEAMKKVSA